MQYRFISFLAPDLVVATLQVAAAFIFLALRTYGTLIDRLSDGKFDPSEGASAGVLIGDQFKSFLQLLDGSGVSPTLITMVFWAAAGSLIYIVVYWMFQTINGAASSASVSRSYTHGQHYDDSSFWSGFAARTGFQIVSVIVFFAALIGLLSFTLPLFTTFYRTSVAGMPDFILLVQMVGAVLAIALHLHVMTVLLRFILLKPRLYNSHKLH